ncbi:prepilin-type N-terminal cleavage/methylation domain-containing protein [Candidatus Saccharibacteria bacterium]|nr:prepilin-type N-terminal cleavage/methylation domain-containing protein [Candidatus Saccharibacteria bacterium]HPR09640.1 prepilin-type N-terminal cleavage/methylation domain-containing protein [Candidatus Saccharibacteria bacterium]
MKLLYNHKGFTIPELIVVMTLTLLFSSLVLSFTFDIWGGASQLQNSSDTLVSRQNLGDTLRNRLNAATTLLNQNSIPDPNTMVSEPTDASGSHWLRIHAVPQTIPIPASGSYTPVIYYSAPAIGTNKQFLMRGSSPYQDEFILYLDGAKKQLKLRVLAVDASPLANPLKTSCPTTIATPTCPRDHILAEDVLNVSTKYFSKSGNPVNWNDVKDPETGASIGPDFSSDVEVVEMSVTYTKRAVIKGRSDSRAQTTVRVALRNG